MITATPNNSQNFFLHVGSHARGHNNKNSLLLSSSFNTLLWKRRKCWVGADNTNYFPLLYCLWAYYWWMNELQCYSLSASSSKGCDTCFLHTTSSSQIWDNPLSHRTAPQFLSPKFSCTKQAAETREQKLKVFTAQKILLGNQPA